MRNQIELQKKQRRALADMARLAQLFLVHDFGVFFEFFFAVSHFEEPFHFIGPKGAILRLFSCVFSFLNARKVRKKSIGGIVFELCRFVFSFGFFRSSCPQSLAAPGFAEPDETACNDREKS